ncbi:acyl-CoA N-acyltransferase [Chytriomyces sp. MP71]|nr:acyl-CoA N-acyltransferase [Chytriomyces sp. MP71]
MSLATDRLLLREFRHTDATAIHECMRDPLTMQFWNTEPHPSPEHTAAWLAHIIAHSNESNSNGVLDFILEHNGQAVGLAGLKNPLNARGHGEVRFVLLRDLCRKGLMREAWTHALLPHLFRDVGATLLKADVDPRNVACINFLTAIGFVETSRTEKTAQVNGVEMDSVYLELERDAWFRKNLAPQFTRVLHSERVLLRQYLTSDIPFFHACMSNEQVMRFWSSPPHTSLQQTKDWMASVFTPGPKNVNGILDFVVYHKPSNRVAGKVGLYQPVVEADGSGEIGYLLHPDFQGQGIMREALQLWLGYAFSETGEGGPGGVQKLIADVDPRNEASLRLLNWFGFVETHRAERTLLVGSEWVDSVYLELTRERFLHVE